MKEDELKKLTLHSLFPTMGEYSHMRKGQSGLSNKLCGIFSARILEEEKINLLYYVVKHKFISKFSFSYYDFPVKSMLSN